MKKTAQVLTWIVKFTRRNTTLKYSVLAFTKAVLALAPLLISLSPYSYLSMEFSRALFLYSVVASFDLALQWYDAFTAKGWFLYLASFTLFVLTLFVVGFSFCGIYIPEFAKDISEKLSLQSFVMFATYSQICWYGIEFVVLLIGELSKKLIATIEYKLPMKVSYATDANKNI